MNYLEIAKAWIQQDPDAQTKAELEKLVEEEALAELEARFATRLQFGTAGLRGELGAGPNRMNRVVVGWAALALARFLQNNRAAYLDSNQELSVVIGFDGRHNSDVFAKDTAEILAGAGIKAMLFDQMVPTPVAAFTGRAHRSSATVVVTASHNPPRDNGYKVYLGGDNGSSQLISPQDAEISDLIDQISSSVTFADIPKGSEIEPLGQNEISAYQDRALELIEAKNSARQNLKISYTAMHGVGYKVIEPIFNSAGFLLNAVPQQRDPDGNFPTVAFPNPEEPGAMDLAFAHGRENQSELIIANDPDADRLAIAVNRDGVYLMLTGDEVGLILGEVVARENKTGTLANSIVSAGLEKVARKHNLNYQATLTGFKWISKVENLIFGYEEALGYCVDPNFTPDKDGITAALLIAELAADLKSKGQDLGDFLAELAQEYGHLATGQVSIRVSDLSIISKIMAGLRANPVGEILGQPCSYEDLKEGKNLPPTDGILLKTDGLRVIIRPSGTEPKLKCYLQVQGDSAEGADVTLESLKTWAKDLLQGLS
ncbi:MAG: phospho-sugar mutase [Aquiluna sp.]|nr:phospho-sugar mutase [Aquiluna sp.]MCF8546251.1 phospho-sugar mutase [Aquiluna sp.]